MRWGGYCGCERVGEEEEEEGTEDEAFLERGRHGLEVNVLCVCHGWLEQICSFFNGDICLLISRRQCGKPSMAATVRSPGCLDAHLANVRCCRMAIVGRQYLSETGHLGVSVKAGRLQSPDHCRMRY